MLRVNLALATCLLLTVLDPDRATSASFLPEPVPERITVERTDGTTSTAARVERWPGDFVRLIGGSGKAFFVPVTDARSIRDESGADVTERVLRHWEGVGTAPVEPVMVDHPSSTRIPARYRPEFVLFHAGMLGRVNAVRGESNVAIALDLGTMRNRSSRYALGGTLGFVGDEEYLRIALKPRLRRWMTSSLALDVAPGIFHAVDAEDSPTTHGSVGFLLETSLIWGGLAVTGQLEVVDRERRMRELVAHAWEYASPVRVESGTEVSYQLGLKLGGGTAIPISVVMLLGFMIAGSTGTDVY